MRGIYKRGKIFYIRFGYKGRMYREPAGHSFQMAQNLLMRRKSQVIENHNKRVKDPEHIKFATFADMYLEEHCKITLKSWKHAEGYLKDLKSFFGDIYLQDITVNDVEEYKAYKRKNLTPSTVNRYLSCLQNLINKAKNRWNYFQGDNPVQKVGKYRENNERSRFLSETEFLSLYNALNINAKKVLIFAVNTGLRKGEIRNLQWPHVDIENRFIHLLAKNTKREKDRKVPLNDAALEILMSFKGNHPLWVFAHPTGERYGDWRRAFETAIRKAQIKDFKFHDNRHTFASWLLMSGKVSLYTVQELLGHSSPEMTQRYAHLSMPHKHDAVKHLPSFNGTITAQGVKSPKIQKSDVVVTHSKSAV